MSFVPPPPAGLAVSKDGGYYLDEERPDSRVSRLDCVVDGWLSKKKRPRYEVLLQQRHRLLGPVVLAVDCRVHTGMVP